MKRFAKCYQWIYWNLKELSFPGLTAVRQVNYTLRVSYGKGRLVLLKKTLASSLVSDVAEKSLRVPEF